LTNLAGPNEYLPSPHIRYEVIANGRKVNLIKSRLPKGSVFSGSELWPSRKNVTGSMA